VTSPPVRTRSFVMVLAGWMALASAAVVALSTPPAAAFGVLAVGLVAVTTLFLTVRWGVGVAAVSLLVFVLAAAVGPAPPWGLGGVGMQRLQGSLTRWQTLAPDLLAAVALAGTAACAELASVGLEWDMVLRGAAGRRRPPVEEKGPEPAPASAVPGEHGSRPRPQRRRRPVRQEEL
jgi:hypothetical protein